MTGEAAPDLPELACILRESGRDHRRTDPEPTRTARPAARLRGGARHRRLAGPARGFARDRSRVEAHETLTLHSGRWRAGTAPPVPGPVTVDGLLGIHGEIVAGCRHGRARRKPTTATCPTFANAL